MILNSLETSNLKFYFIIAIFLLYFFFFFLLFFYFFFINLLFSNIDIKFKLFR